jgi:hypothetical protein
MNAETCKCAGRNCMVSFPRKRESVMSSTLIGRSGDRENRAFVHPISGFPDHPIGVRDAYEAKN